VAIYLIPAGTIRFPPVEEAEPDGLLAVGGDLSPACLLTAYASGIFPWYSEKTPILWWSPDPRCILPLDAVHVPRSLKKDLRRSPFEYTLNGNFAEVIRRCAESPRPGQDGTWLVKEMRPAYERLHRLGRAHSAEAWRDGRLAGGIYGVALGRAFFGESMFYAEPNASKAALLHLVEQLKRRGFTLFDCQQDSAHMRRFGALEIRRTEFMLRLKEALARTAGSFF
jgi:leucyl/phenylalanyl-tRNA--protein transferase